MGEEQEGIFWGAGKVHISVWMVMMWAESVSYILKIRGFTYFMYVISQEKENQKGGRVLPSIGCIVQLSKNQSILERRHLSDPLGIDKGWGQTFSPSGPRKQVKVRQGLCELRKELTSLLHRTAAPTPLPAHHVPGSRNDTELT